MTVRAASGVFRFASRTRSTPPATATGVALTDIRVWVPHRFLERVHAPHDPIAEPIPVET